MESSPAPAIHHIDPTGFEGWISGYCGCCNDLYTMGHDVHPSSAFPSNTMNIPTLADGFPTARVDRLINHTATAEAHGSDCLNAEIA